MKTVGFILKRDVEKAHEIAQALTNVLVSHGVKVLLGDDAQPLDRAQTVDRDDLAKSVECLIVVGGDGTFLAAAKQTFGLPTKLIGVNMGHLGFLTEVDVNNAENLTERLLDGGYTCAERPFFTLSLERDGKTITEPFLNDAVLQRDAHEKVIEYSVDVGSQYMMSGKADGLIVATPTGSTAYNLSTGGPIVYPTIDGLILSPISPHKLSFRPVVIPPRDVVIGLKSPHAHLSIDGRPMGKLLMGETLVVHKSEHTAKLLHDPRHNFFDLLRFKLGWDLPPGMQ